MTGPDVEPLVPTREQLDEARADEEQSGLGLVIAMQHAQREAAEAPPEE